MNKEKLDNKNVTTDGVWQSRSLFRYLFHICRLLLGLVFVYASYDKILQPQAFALAVFNYQLVPDLAVNLIALILPWLELLLGLCLLFGVWLPGATIAGNGLLVFFLGALVFNQIRGLDIHCGCFSTEIQEGAAGLGTVLRDLGFLAMSLYLLLYIFFYKPRNKRP
ncbi:MAG: MauE/DoxX family redox-associated membrane protein [Desulfopila sp.]